MPDHDYRIRVTRPDDIAQVTAIYAREVLTGTASFETEPPSESEMRHRIDGVLAGGYCHLVAVRGSTVLGYAYTSVYRARPGYRFTVEDSVYVLPESRGLGIASALLRELINDCGNKPFRQMVAIIGDSANHASINLHRKAGFRQVGVLKNVGYKLNRWVNSVIMQRELGSGADTHPVDD